jgi:hypothetical protein
MKSLEEQFAMLAQQFPGATCTLVDGVHLIRLPEVLLPDGWSKPATNVEFVVPHGFPYAFPDSFWTDPDLRLANGQLPTNVQPGYVCPGQTNVNLLWFSWHIAPNSWNPSTANLLTFVHIIKNRLEARK